MEELIVNSSCLAAANYDRDTQILTVVFKSDGAQHSYGNVPEEIWAGLQTATSVGNYFNNNIRDVFPEVAMA